MNLITEIEKLPPHLQQEVFDYVEFLIHKYQNEITVSDPWIKEIKRGMSSGETASETTIKMRDESPW